LRRYQAACVCLPCGDIKVVDLTGREIWHYEMMMFH
jgi:hypothetical protein